MKTEKISTQHAQCAIRDATFVMERDHLRARIVNTARMIQSYWQEYQDHLMQVVSGHERIEKHHLADVAIKTYYPPLPPLPPSDRPNEAENEKEIGILERRLKVVNRISWEMQELRAYDWVQKCE